MKWKDKVFNEVLRQIGDDDDQWQDIVVKMHLHRNDFGVHVAIFTEPYLTYLIEGKKTVESRFSVNKISPYGKVHEGDLVLVKKGGGPVVALFKAGRVRFYSKLNVSKLKTIENEFAKNICSTNDPDFWKNRENSKFATLVEVSAVKQVEPFAVGKSDRTAWSIVQNKVNSLFD